MDDGDVVRPLMCIREYNLETAGIIKEAYLMPSTTKVSQVFGGLMAAHEEMRQKVPEYLTGCVDAIYAYGLYRLHLVALYQRNTVEATNDDLTKSILAVLDAHRADMRHYADKRFETPSEPCTCKKAGIGGKKGSCQSPIMEA